MIDTHCHIHEADYSLDQNEVIEQARLAGVSKLICVGTDAESSFRALEFAKPREQVWATAGLHPHDADKLDQLCEIRKLTARQKVVAIGECGLDYYYLNSPKKSQQVALRLQFELATQNDLPMVFHLRGKLPDSSDAYADFWKIFDDFEVNGVIHSFTAESKQLEQIIERDLAIGVNGISTFMKPGPQLKAIKSIPLSKMLLETDSPFLTPVPFRKQVNQPKFISTIVEFISQLLEVPKEVIEEQTTLNAEQLFDI